MSTWIAGIGIFTPDDCFVPPYDESRIIVLDFSGLEVITGVKVDRWHANVVGTQLWASGESETLAWIALVAYWRLLLMEPFIPKVETPEPTTPQPAPVPKSSTKQHKQGRRSKRRKRKK